MEIKRRATEEQGEHQSEHPSMDGVDQREIRPRDSHRQPVHKCQEYRGESSGRNQECSSSVSSQGLDVFFNNDTFLKLTSSFSASRS